MLTALHLIAERKIAEAIENGDLNPQGWKGRPLPKDDMAHVAGDLRMAYKILKNAGYLPAEIETRKEIEQLEELIAATEDEHARLRQIKKLNVLLFKLNATRQRPITLEANSDYHRKVVEKVEVAPPKKTTDPRT